MKSVIVAALDGMSPEQALVNAKRAKELGVEWFKVGLELFTQSGPDLIGQLKAENCKVFLDLKLFDIPQTVGAAVARIGSLGVDMTTVHLLGGEAMIRAAVESSAGAALSVVGVTCLTSWSDEDCTELFKWGLRDMPNIIERSVVVPSLIARSKSWGLNGVVCSVPDLQAASNAGEVLPVRWAEEGFIWVTPGIRGFNQVGLGDQKSVGTPEMARKAGSTHLVVGRPLWTGNLEVNWRDLQSNLNKG